MSGNFAAGRGRRGSAASRRIGRLMGEGVEGRAAASRAVLRAVNCRGFRRGRGTADSERRLQSRSAEGERGEVCGAGRRSCGGGESRRASQGKCRSSAGGRWRISAESEVAEKSREPEMFSRRGVAVRLRGGGKRSATLDQKNVRRNGEGRASGDGRHGDVRCLGKRRRRRWLFFVGEGRKSPNCREKGEGRRSATPSRISQAREASASLRCGGFECLGSVGAAQRRGAGSPGRFVFALSGGREQKFRNLHGDVDFTYKERTLPPRTEAPCPAPLREEQSRLSVTFRLPRIGWRQNGRVI